VSACVLICVSACAPITYTGSPESRHIQLSARGRAWYWLPRSLENKSILMYYSSTKNLLESIIRWLKTEVPQEEVEWQSQTDLVQACITEMVQMAGPSVHPQAGVASRYVHRPAADKLNRAMPHVRSMLTAMRERDRTTALAHGETTLQRL
jgi:hypothetical protein